MKRVLVTLLALLSAGIVSAQVSLPGGTSSGSSSGNFTPGGALSGNATSQNVNLAAGSPFIFGTLPTTLLPAFSGGDCTTPGGSGVLTCTKLNGTTPGGSCTNQAVTSLSASAVPFCSTITASFVNNTIALTGTDINTSNQVTATHLTAALPVSQGGTGTASTLTGLVRGSASAMTGAELSGDVTTAGSNAATIAANAVTNTKLAQMAASTMKGNNTGATANAADLTAAQALTMLMGPFVYVAPQTGADTPINAAITTLNTGTGGTVLLGAGTYTLAAPIVPKSGVSIVGVSDGPIVNYTSATIPDSNLATANGGGTIINCGGGAGFQWNKTALGSTTAAAFTAAGVTNAAIKNLGFTNCTRAIDAGNTNNPAGWYLTFENLYIAADSDWGFWVTNFMHCTFRRIWAVANTNGQMFFGNDVPQSVLQPGNSFWEDLYANTPSTNTNLSRGIVYFVTQGQQNEGFGSRIQSNRNNASTVTQAATMANTSPNITVTDGTKFLVGMPVAFSATVNGFTANQIYFVVSVATNVLQVSNTFSGTAINATGATAVNITTQGFPALEVISLAGSALSSHHFTNIDVENGGTAAIALQNVQASTFNINQVPLTSQSTITIVARNVTFSQAFTQAASNTDFDSSSTSFAYYGFRAAGSVQRNPPGHFFDQTSNQWFLNFSGSVQGLTDTVTGDATHVIVPQTGFGFKLTQVTTATTTLQAQNSGLVVNTFTGGAATWTLPNISTTTGNSQYLFDIVNAGSNAITLNVNGTGTQTFANKAGLTSLTINVNAGIRLAGGIKDANGNSYWAVTGIGGTYAAGIVSGL